MLPTTADNVHSINTNDIDILPCKAHHEELGIMSISPVVITVGTLMRRMTFGKCVLNFDGRQPAPLGSAKEEKATIRTYLAEHGIRVDFIPIAV